MVFGVGVLRVGMTVCSFGVVTVVLLSGMLCTQRKVLFIEEGKPRIYT